MPRTLLIGNPTAQSGRNAERIELARKLLDARGVSHRFASTEPDGGTVEVVRRHIDEMADGAVEARSDGSSHRVGADLIDTVVYMGGDGTFAEAAKGILASSRAAEVRLGMLPTGTANDQGKSFGLGSTDEDLERNVEVVAAGHETLLDAGRIQALAPDGTLVKQDWFFDSAGWGISPRVLAVRNEDRQLIANIPIVREVYRDQLVYAGALLRTFLGSYVEDGKFNARVVVDDHPARELVGLTDLVVKATRVYGGLWVLDPAAQHDDGRFEVVPFLGKRDWVSKAIVHLDGSGFVAGALSTLGVTHSENLSGGHIELDFEEQPGMPVAAQIDGEEFPATLRVVIDVVPRALRLIVP